LLPEASIESDRWLRRSLVPLPVVGAARCRTDEAPSLPRVDPAIALLIDCCRPSVVSKTTPPVASTSSARRATKRGTVAWLTKPRNIGDREIPPCARREAFTGVACALEL
jgi:hypothetical protein